MLGEEEEPFFYFFHSFPPQSCTVQILKWARPYKDQSNCRIRDLMGESRPTTVVINNEIHRSQGSLNVGHPAGERLISTIRGDGQPFRESSELSRGPEVVLEELRLQQICQGDSVCTLLPMFYFNSLVFEVWETELYLIIKSHECVATYIDLSIFSWIFPDGFGRDRVEWKKKKIPSFTTFKEF